MSKNKRKYLNKSEEKLILGKQNFQCANKINNQIRGLENYDCPLWNKLDCPGNFDESGWEFDHIVELAISNDNSIENFQALCKSCHTTKTKRFVSKFNSEHEIYGKYIYSLGKEDIYLADSRIISKKSKIWSRNRPPDFERVEEIKNHILEKNLVDGIIYLAETKEGLICYDGNHRREALKMLDKNFKILVNIVKNPSEEFLIEKFRDLNKCVPITDLVFSSTTTRDEIQKIKIVCEHFMKKWKEHRKGSSRPRKPNFNQNMLENKIDTVLKKYKKDINEISQEEIIKYTDLYNLKIKKNLDNYKIKKEIKDKCLRNNCYLFLEN